MWHSSRCQLRRHGIYEHFSETTAIKKQRKNYRILRIVTEIIIAQNHSFTEEKHEQIMRYHLSVTFIAIIHHFTSHLRYCLSSIEFPTTHFYIAAGTKSSSVCRQLFKYISLMKCFDFGWFITSLFKQHKSPLVQVMHWRWTGDKSLSEPIVGKFIDAYMRHLASMG